jgi:hypothetical protein
MRELLLVGTLAVAAVAVAQSAGTSGAKAAPTPSATQATPGTTQGTASATQSTTAHTQGSATSTQRTTGAVAVSQPASMGANAGSVDTGTGSAVAVGFGDPAASSAPPPGEVTSTPK